MEPSQDIAKWKALVRYDINQAASEFCDFPPDKAAEMANALGNAFMAQMIAQLGTDAAADMLGHLPGDVLDKILAGVDPERAGLLREILSYPPGTAGAFMAKEYLWVPLDYTIQQTTKYLQSLPKDKKGKISYIYVVDAAHRLEGVIQIRDLVFHAPDKPVREILKCPVVQVETAMLQTDVARLLVRHRYLGLPVVDATQRLVGVISADTAMKAMEEEASADIAKIIGTSAEELRTHSVRRIVSFRLPWLLVSIASGLVCAFISGVFQNNIQTIATLFLFVPVVLGLSESTGVQGATIVVRNLALGNISYAQLSALFLRETLAGILIGSICGLIVGATAWAWQAGPRIGLALTFSMALTISLSALIGLALPLIFKRFKIDPAFASGPLVLAICDIQTLLVYFSLSSAILGPA